MLKVIAACGNGMGSSQVIKMKISKVFKKLGVDAQVDHNSVGEDFFFFGEPFSRSVG